jgi:hypothetical protein
VSLKITALDIDVLPTRLLTQAKEQMRVDYADDDDLIKSIVARAIANFQNRNDVVLNPTTVLWKPSADEFKNGGATIPVCPVTEFTAAAGGDVSANYELMLKWNSITGVPIQVLQGAFVNGLAVTLTAGIPGGPPGPPPELDLTPAVLDIILRHAAHLYEHREIMMVGRDEVSPDLQVDATWWVPRV